MIKSTFEIDKLAHKYQVSKLKLMLACIEIFVIIITLKK